MSDRVKCDAEEVRIQKGLRIISTACGLAPKTSPGKHIDLPSGTWLEFDEDISYRIGRICRKLDSARAKFVITEIGEAPCEQLVFSDHTTIRVDSLLGGQYATVLTVPNSNRDPADCLVNNLIDFDRTRRRVTVERNHL